MRYGFTRGATTVVVGAAQTVVELETWYESVRGSNDGYLKDRPSSFMDHLRDADLKGYKHPAYIFDFATVEDLENFTTVQQVTVLPHYSVKDFHEDMLAEKRGSLGYSDHDLSDNRTLEEMHGLDQEDRFDKRSDEAKQAALDGKNKVDQMKKRVGDSVTGSSFDPNPRGGPVDDGTFSVTGVSVGQNNSVAVSATKRAGVTTAPVQVSSQQMIDDDEDNLQEESEAASVDTLAQDLLAAGFSEEKVDAWRAQVESTPDIDMQQITAQVKATIVNRKIQKALEPVAGVTSVDQAIDIVEDRLNQIPELTPDRAKQLRDAAYANMTAPKPKPGDYKFAQNQKLTDLRSMRGEGTPIFHLEVNKMGPNLGKFSVHDGAILIETFGLNMVSNGIFAYEVREDDPKYQADARQHLIDSGFVEDTGILPVAVQPKVGGGKHLRPEDFRKALAGDGTSAVEGTESYGKNQLGKSEKDYIEEMKPGLIGDRAATIDQDGMLAKAKWDELPEELRKALETAIAKPPKEVLIGRYSGVTIGDGNTIMVLGPDDKLVDTACINIRHLGETRIPGGSTALAVVRDQRGAYGFVVVQGKKDLKIYTLG